MSELKAQLTIKALKQTVKVATYYVSPDDMERLSLVREVLLKQFGYAVHKIRMVRVDVRGHEEVIEEIECE